MNPFIDIRPEPRPITREEFERFVESSKREIGKPKEITILVHPSDLKAAKQFWGVKA